MKGNERKATREQHLAPYKDRLDREEGSEQENGKNIGIAQDQEQKDTTAGKDDVLGYQQQEQESMEEWREVRNVLMGIRGGAHTLPSKGKVSREVTRNAIPEPQR